MFFVNWDEPTFKLSAITHSSEAYQNYLIICSILYVRYESPLVLYRNKVGDKSIVIVTVKTEQTPSMRKTGIVLTVDLQSRFFFNLFLFTFSFA